MESRSVGRARAVEFLRPDGRRLRFRVACVVAQTPGPLREHIAYGVPVVVRYRQKDVAAAVTVVLDRNAAPDGGGTGGRPVRLRPPVVAGMWSLVGWTMHWALPEALDLSGAARRIEPVPLGPGLPPAGWAPGRFRRRGATFGPFNRPSAPVRGGPYPVSPNPIYLDLLLVQSGCALLAGGAAHPSRPWASC